MRVIYNIKKKRSRGFVLLMAVMLSTVVLSVGLSMASIAFKEITLSITGRDSVLAFYAADAGMECASYWDIRGTDIFPINDAISYNVPRPTYCNSQDITVARDGVPDEWNLQSGVNPVRSSTGATTKFALRLGETNNLCVDVTVEKVWNDNENNPQPPNFTIGVIDPGEVATKITANGFSSCNVNNLRRVQRTLEQTY